MTINSSKPLFIIGDVHESYDQIELPIDPSNLLFVGDLGGNWTWYESLIEQGHEVYLLRGNHDDAEMFKDHMRAHIGIVTGLYLLDDVELLSYKNKGILCISGAISIDRIIAPERNKTGIAFNALTLVQELLNGDLDVDLMVSHTCPTRGHGGKQSKFYDSFCYEDESLDQDVKKEMLILQKCFDISKSTKSIFGHFHRSYQTKDKQDRIYTCLDISEVFEVI